MLWTAIACLHRAADNIICLVYTGDVDATKREIVEKVKVSHARLQECITLHC